MGRRKTGTWGGRIPVRLGVAACAAALVSISQGPVSRGLAQEATVPPPPIPPPPADAPEPEAGTFPYEVRLEGVDGEGELEGLIREASSLIRLQDEPPPSAAGLRRRAQTDEARIVQAMRSLGYYDGVVDIAVDPDATPAVVTVGITPGPRYTFDVVEVVAADGRPLPIDPPSPADLDLEKGRPALARQVVAAQERLADAFAKAGRPFARVVDRRAVVDHGKDAMDVTYVVDPGPPVRFGGIVVNGLEEVNRSLVQGRVLWKPGDRYDPQRMSDTRQALQDLEVFNSVTTQIPDRAPPPGPDGSVDVPVTITVSERPRRFIGAGIEYSTEDGFGGNFYWGHRNVFGGGEQFRLTGEVANLYSGSQSGDGTVESLTYRFGAQFRKPDFLWTRQSLVLEAVAAVERPEGYQREGFTTTARLEWKATPRLTLTYGLTGEVSRTRRDGDDTDGDGRGDREIKATLVGVPLGLAYDRSNSLLNPTSGYRVFLNTTPYYPLAGGDPFVINRVTGTAYYDLRGDGNYVLAGRASVGSILGGEAEDSIPFDKRFYVGGGGSVRGYGYQKAGPLDPDGDPIGGRSLVELGLEFRIKVTENIGIVPFLDAGTVSGTSFPTVEERLSLGAGIGLRYYTGFGPIRLDVAVPLNKRREDSAFALYISVGQAF